MARTIAIGNQKGGVGKTAITAGLTDALRHRGKKVLVVDSDPQANVTTILDIEVDEETLTLNDVLDAVHGPKDKGVAADAIIPAGEWWEGVDLIPAERKLANREKDTSVGSESRLRTALSGVTDGYDFVLIDCPPSLGTLTINALVAADEALIVTQPRNHAVGGVGEFVTTLANVRDYYNEKLEVSGIVINQYAEKRTDPALWINALKEQYNGLVFHPAGVIPDREVISQAASAHVGVSAYGVKSADVWRPLKYLGDRVIAGK